MQGEMHNDIKQDIGMVSSKLYIQLSYYFSF